MSETARPHLPIGYWLKKADEVLTARINEAQSANDLSRTEWQLINVLHESGTASYDELAEPLRPFTTVASMREAVEGLVERGLVEGESNGSAGYRLSANGRRVHAEALELQK